MDFSLNGGSRVHMVRQSGTGFVHIWALFFSTVSVAQTLLCIEVTIGNLVRNAGLVVWDGASDSAFLMSSK